MVAKNEKTVWLRRELQGLRVGLAAQNKDLETDYHKTTTTTSKLDLFFIYFIWLVMAWIFMSAQTMCALLSFLFNMNALTNFSSSVLYLTICCRLSCFLQLCLVWLEGLELLALSFLVG